MFDEEEFAGLDVPVLLLVGGNSPAMHRKAVERLDAVLPRSEIVILPGQEHMAHHTSPKLVARDLLEFISR